MKFTNRIFLVLLATISCYAQQSSPYGFASMNGGTTGGAGGTVVEVTTIAQLQDYASRSGKYIIYVKGVMGDNTVNTSNRVQVASDKTIYGIPGHEIRAWITISNVNNVILRNLKIKGPGAVDVDGQDAVNISGSTNVWVDHCDISDGQDGNLDVINGSNYVTISWTRFSYSSLSQNHMYCNLIGNSDTKTTDRGKLKTTMHHNWWDNGVIERMPRVRFGEVHVVNNYFSSNRTNYAVRAGIEANIRVEANEFDFDGKAVDLDGSGIKVTVTNDNIFGPDVSNKVGSGTAFTPPYTMPIDNANEVESKVRAGAGATLPDPRSTPPSSSSTVPSSSSIAPSSSSSTPSSSSITPSSSSVGVSSSSAVVSSSSVIPLVLPSFVIQGENFCNAMGVAETKNAGFQGAAYLNFDNATGADAQYTLNSASAQNIALQIGYANGGTANRELQIWVNGSQGNSASFAPTGSWTTWATQQINISLASGFNTLRFVSTTSEGGPNLDWFGSNASGLNTTTCDAPVSSSSQEPISSSSEDPVALYVQPKTFTAQLSGSALQFNLDQAQNINVEVYDMLGNRLHSASHFFQSGAHEYILDSVTAESGIYMIRLIPERSHAQNFRYTNF
jgi:pectate lyase